MEEQGVERRNEKYILKSFFEKIITMADAEKDFYAAKTHQFFPNSFIIIFGLFSYCFDSGLYCRSKATCSQSGGAHLLFQQVAQQQNAASRGVHTSNHDSHIGGATTLGSIFQGVDLRGA